jgi:RHS repeat-associated protein
VEQASNSWRTPYRFTGKELDEETGLYYFGARYYDPRTSVWQSVDPILWKYFPNGNKERDAKLPGMGGVYNSRNLGLYGYAGLNPLIFIDPDGNELTTFQARGLTTDDTILKARTYYADTTVANAMANFAASAHESFGISVNNTFREKDSSTIKTNNTRSKGLSRHQAGFAIDFNGVKLLSPAQLKELNSLAAEHGFAPLPDQASDLPHFSADPMQHGYNSLKEAVDVNRKDYFEKTQPNTQPNAKPQEAAPQNLPLGDYVPINDRLA